MVAWHPRGSTLEQLLDSLRRQVAPRPGALVVGLTRRPVTPSREWGLSSYREALAVLSIRTLGNRYGLALAHEVAHVLGAVHTAEPGHVMARSLGPRLSAVNAALIRLHRDRDFAERGFPLPGDRLAAALRLYRGVDQDDARSLGRLVRAELRETRASARVRQGLAHLEAERHGDAAASFERAAALDPDRLAAWVNLAAARLLLGLDGPTEEACRRALALDPDAHRALSTLGLLRRAQGRTAEALELQRRALRLAPGDLDVIASLADLHLDLGRRRTARDLYQRVVVGRPADGFAHNNLAVVLYRLGDVACAAAHAERAVQLGVPVAPALLRAVNERRASR